MRSLGGELCEQGEKLGGDLQAEHSRRGKGEEKSGEGQTSTVERTLGPYIDDVPTHSHESLLESTLINSGKFIGLFFFPHGKREGTGRI